jgi:hypothetical protein
MINKFNKFISENKESEYLIYYAFDWDDNILNMPTTIYMEKKDGDRWIPVNISTAKFAIIRNDKENYRIFNNDPNIAFSEFTDYGPRGKDAFLMDVKSAISNKNFGPSWNDFIKCLTHGCLFSIITARGHESESIRKGIEWIIDNVLTKEQHYQMYNYLLKYAHIFRIGEEVNYDRILKGIPSKNELVKIYLDNCDFVSVSSPSRGGSAEDPEKAKEDALIQFNIKINKFASSVGLKAKIGFSDDDLKNVKQIENLIDNIKHEQFPNIVKYIVKNTKDPSNITKKVKTIITETSHQTSGLESSILKFTQFGNMTGSLYPKGPYDRQDDYKNKINRESEYLAKMSKEIFCKKRINKKNKKNKKFSKKHS